jgi:hypothetical protein
MVPLQIPCLRRLQGLCFLGFLGILYFWVHMYERVEGNYPSIANTPKVSKVECSFQRLIYSPFLLVRPRTVLVLPKKERPVVWKAKRKSRPRVAWGGFSWPLHSV